MSQPITLIQSDGAIATKRARVESILRELGSVLVAYSGGVDSTLLLRMARDVLGERAGAAIAVSDSIPEEEIESAGQVAGQMGVTLHQVRTREFENEAYRANGPDRCYHCKVALFDELEPLAAELGLAQVIYGANEDDRGDFRPGQGAARQRGVRAPLMESGLGKVEIRELSRQLGLPTWNKPSYSCLSSRIPYGTRIEMEVLERVAAAERFLRDLGVVQVRVRTHEAVARIEVDDEGFALLAQPGMRRQVADHLKELGYEYVSLDLEGFRSGSMNPRPRGGNR